LVVLYSITALHGKGNVSTSVFHPILPYTLKSFKMTWATAEVKEILVANGSEYFEKKGADRDSFVEKIVSLLKAVQDNLDQNVSAIFFFTATSNK
jgi:hypothetical protein